MSQYKRWDCGVISSVMSRNLQSHRPLEVSVEVPTCRPDTVRAEPLPQLLRGSGHALQPIFLEKVTGTLFASDKV